MVILYMFNMCFLRFGYVLHLLVLLIMYVLSEWGKRHEHSLYIFLCSSRLSSVALDQIEQARCPPFLETSSSRAELPSCGNTPPPHFHPPVPSSSLPPPVVPKNNKLLGYFCASICCNDPALGLHRYHFFFGGAPPCTLAASAIQHSSAD